MILTKREAFQYKPDAQASESLFPEKTHSLALRACMIATSKCASEGATCGQQNPRFRNGLLKISQYGKIDTGASFDHCYLQLLNGKWN